MKNEGSETRPKIKFKNIIAHFNTITHHRHIVRRNCFKMGLYWQGLTHDLSKYSPSEFWPSVRYYQGTRSPLAAEREATGMSEAWLHHKGRNKHHHEYWNDFTHNSPNPGGLVPCKMPDRYIAEMIADRVAACRVYKGSDYKPSDSLDYYNLEKTVVMLHPYVKEKLELFLIMLAEKGEEETFRYIKKEFLKK